MKLLSIGVEESWKRAGASVFKANDGISAPSFYRQVAALVTDMFCNFYLVKNHKKANDSSKMTLAIVIQLWLEGVRCASLF